MASDDKYDRQIRLWGPHGQKCLSTSHIVMIGTSSAGSETLKNLVLPGIGMFTIVGDDKVTTRDFGNEFLVTRDDCGKNKAEVLKNALVEMNPDVKGNHVEMNLEAFLAVAENVKMLEEAALVIACDVTQVQAVALGKVTEKNNKALCIIRQYGMLGYLRVYKPEISLFESKSSMDPYKRDLNMAQPWDELKAFTDKFDLFKMEYEASMHTPWLCILSQAIKIWKETHADLPKTFPEKAEFKAVIKTMNKYNEANFDEAISAVTDVWQTPMPYELDEIFKNPLSDNGTTLAWCFTAALKRFYQSEKRLPLSGSVPDMISEPKVYQEIQAIYINKAEADRKIMKGHLEAYVAEKGIKDFVFDENAWKIFCKNIKQIKFIYMRGLKEEIESPDWSHASNDFWDPESCVKWFVTMRCFENLRTQGHMLLGEDFENQNAEYALMRAEADKITAGIEQEPIEEKYLREILRFGMSKIHNISAYMGGQAASECIKLMIKQYIPINHTLVFDGIHCRGSVYNL